ncbi:hypothetical protein PFISCL1PPCAC_7990, partial [Pristionchus fissidentatus]
VFRKMRFALSLLLLSFVYTSVSSLNATFFKEKLAKASLSDAQIEQIAEKFNKAAKPKQAINNIVKSLPKKVRAEVKKVLNKINDANSYIDGMFKQTIDEAKKVVNSTVIKQFESIKDSHDDAFKANFAVAQASLIKAASKMVDNSTLTQLKTALNSPLAKIGNDTKGLDKLKSFITYFQ